MTNKMSLYNGHVWIKVVFHTRWMISLMNLHVSVNEMTSRLMWNYIILPLRLVYLVIEISPGERSLEGERRGTQQVQLSSEFIRVDDYHTRWINIGQGGRGAGWGEPVPLATLVTEQRRSFVFRWRSRRFCVAGGMYAWAGFWRGVGERDGGRHERGNGEGTAY